MSTTAHASSRSKTGGFRRFWRAVKQLFHEAIGAMFAVLAFAWLSAVLRAWKRDVAPWLIVIALATVLLFVFFSITSFHRARKL